MWRRRVLLEDWVTVDKSQCPSKFHFADTFNCASVFIDRHPEEGRAEKAAIRTVDESVSYGQLAERVNRCGNALRDLGIAPGERALLVVKDSPEFFYLVWGAIKAGIVPVALNTLLRDSDYQFMIEDSECAAIFFSPEYAANVESAAGLSRPSPRQVIATTGAGALADLMQAASPELASHPARADDDCLWLYSSGSTGKPKGVVHAHKDSVIVAQLFAAETQGIVEDDVIFSAAKLFFSYGFGNAMLFPLWLGATAVLSDQVPTPEMTFEIIERFRPTVYFGVPTLYARQLAEIDQLHPDLSSIRLAVSAGEPLPPALYRGWIEKTGTPILDGIGSTEVHHIFISNTPTDHQPGSAGRPVPGYQVMLTGDDGLPVETGEVGTLKCRGESIARYYWKNPERTAETIEDGWINTGDMMRQDEDGRFIYCGRADDMMKVGGIWCSPAEIEARLVEHPSVLEAAVVARQDSAGLVKPEAYVVLKDQDQIEDQLDQVLTEYCKSGLARYKYPRWVNFVETLPKTATGKIQRFKLRADA
ncbi:MAG: benzoate--CoA ligase [Rhodospirillaceae bacterium]|nr:benzoate--CoA ligase [Rhodospirillaceae bacterium]